MPGKLRGGLQNLKIKLGISEPLDALELFEQVIPVVPLDSVGFFTSAFGLVTSTPAAAVTNDASFICPTNKIRRIISMSMDANGAITSYFARWRATPTTGVPVYLPVQEIANRRIVQISGMLWHPGTELAMQTNHAAAQTTEFTVGFTEEESGVKPTD